MKQRLKTIAAALYKRLPLWCYAAALALWLGLAVADYIGDGLRAEAALDPAAAALSNIDYLGEGRYFTQNADPQLAFINLNTDLRVVRLDFEIDRQPGEMELFYTREGAGFSPGRRVIGVPQDDGGYLYFLPAGHVASLRIDPGTLGGIPVSITGIRLNPKLSAAHYFLPGPRVLMALAVLPALASAAIYAIIEMAEFCRRRFKTVLHNKGHTP